MLYYSSCNFYTHVFLYYAILHSACFYFSGGLAVIRGNRLHSEKQIHRNLIKIAGRICNETNYEFPTVPKLHIQPKISKTALQDCSLVPC